MRVFNFSAGPAVLPESVLAQAQSELLEWRNSGMSVMEMSHRGKEFTQIAAEAEADLRTLMGIPDNYKVLFLQGGASAQFAMMPMNLLRGKKQAAYVNTGHWSTLAMKEARRYTEVVEVASSTENQFSDVPLQTTWDAIPEDAAYLHYTPNETIGGVEFHWTPNAPADIPLVADMSSNILSKPIEVNQFGLIYAGAQKNIGPAGVTLVIVREDLIGQTVAGTPTMYDYKIHADQGSMYNTPPTYGMYIAGLVFKALLAEGGLVQAEEKAIRKSGLLYAAIDHSEGFYQAPVAVAARSRMNIPFKLNDQNLDSAFLKEAEQAGLVQLKGHRVVGGMRASLYNAMPEAGVQALVSFMGEFARRYG